MPLCATGSRAALAAGTRRRHRGKSATQGESLDQARAMVRDAIELVLEERRERGETIPPTGWALA